MKTMSKILGYRQKYYQKHKEKELAYGEKWRKDNPKYALQWRKDNPSANKEYYQKDKLAYFTKKDEDGG